MSRTITTEDKRLALSRWLSVSLKIEILNSNGTVLDELIGVTEFGTVGVDASSYTRRTYSFTLSPTNQNTNIGEKSLIWIDKTAKLYIGLKTPRDKDYTWYPYGEFVFTDTSSTFNATTNTLSVNCGDLFKNIDGTCDGQLNALQTNIPAYTEDEDGSPIQYTIIRDALILVINELAGIEPTKIFVDDIGESKGIQQYNKDYMEYRQTHPQWNCLPYDLEYSAGDHISSIVEDIVELYPTYDACFDYNGNFITQLIPSCAEDDVVLTNDEIQLVLNSEQCTTDLSKVRNVVHVWGKVLEADWYSENCSQSGNVYVTNIDGYGDSYNNGDVIAIKLPSTNSDTQFINVNSVGNVRLYDENTDAPLNANVLSAGNVYVFKYRKNYINNAWDEKFYLQGQWQAHALCALVDGTKSEIPYTCADGTITTLYTEKYFQDKYAVDTVYLQVIKDSPFVVQKIGERKDIKNGAEFDNISSDSLALERAKYELYKDARLTDNITITLATILPWLDEYKKVSYVKKNETDLHEYVTQQISLNLTDGSTTVTMYRFYPLYEN